jgi:hypothetical protein
MTISLRLGSSPERVAVDISLRPGGPPHISDEHGFTTDAVLIYRATAMMR